MVRGGPLGCIPANDCERVTIEIENRFQSLIGQIIMAIGLVALIMEVMNR